MTHLNQHRGSANPIRCKCGMSFRDCAVTSGANAADTDAAPSPQIAEVAELPRWIDNLKGSDMTIDSLIQYIVAQRDAIAASRRTGQAERLDEAVMTLLCDHTKLNQDGVDVYAQRIAAMLNHVALNPVPADESVSASLPDVAMPEQFADRLRSAIQTECPIPSSPHTSVLLHTQDERSAMWRGAKLALKLIAAQPAEASAQGAKAVPMCETCDDPAMLQPNGQYGICQACIDFHNEAAKDDRTQPAAALSPIGVQAAAGQQRFYMDHGVWHDRVTGQHLWTQDQYDEQWRDMYKAGQEHAAIGYNMLGGGAVAAEGATPADECDARQFVPVAWYADIRYDLNEDKQGDWPPEWRTRRSVTLGVERPKTNDNWKPLVDAEPIPVCGDNAVLPARFVGCGEQIGTWADVYRCTHCDAALHKHCAEKHFLDNNVLTDDQIDSMTPEELRKVRAAMARIDATSHTSPTGGEGA